MPLLIADKGNCGAVWRPGSTCVPSHSSNTNWNTTATFASPGQRFSVTVSVCFMLIRVSSRA